LTPISSFVKVAGTSNVMESSVTTAAIIFAALFGLSFLANLVLFFVLIREARRPTDQLRQEVEVLKRFVAFLVGKLNGRLEKGVYTITAKGLRNFCISVVDGPSQGSPPRIVFFPSSSVRPSTVVRHDKLKVDHKKTS